MDSEASGLDTRRAKMAGMSLSFAAGQGYYLPTGHTVGTELNLPLDEIVRCIWHSKIQREGYIPVFYNAKYDLNILQVATKEKILKFEDALELVYLGNPDRMDKGLKEVAKQDFGVDMARFESLFSAAEIKSGKLVINDKHPRICIDYASADADMGLRVWHKYQWVVSEFPKAVAVDTGLIDIVRRMEHNGGMELNVEYIDQQIKNLEDRAEVLKELVFEAAGYKFEIGSPKQLGIALFEKMAIPHQGMTKGKNPIYSTREETLDKIRKTYPVVEYVISYRKVIKAQGSYFEKLKRLERYKMKPRFNFNMFAAPTFRFAAPGGDPTKDGATGVNIQAVSNGEAREIPGVDLTERSDLKEALASIDQADLLVDDLLHRELPKIPMEGDFTDPITFPYVLRNEEEHPICIRSTCNGCTAYCHLKGIDITRRMQKGVMVVPSVRESFRAPIGWKLVSFDYDRQELVIGANMSREPKWLRALAANEDLHISTACAAFGMTRDEYERLPKLEQKRRRGIGKVLNFAIFYGANAYTIQTKAQITKMLAEQIYDGFVKGHPTMMGWIKKVHIFARKNGYTTTYFGRKRWLNHIYDRGKDDPKMMAFGDRSAVNTAIQGTAAEVTRIAMRKVEARIEKAGLTWKEVKPVLQIHDELAYLIRDEVILQAAPLVKEAMEFKVKSWQVQLSAGMKYGDIWGIQKEVKDFAKWQEAGDPLEWLKMAA